MTRLALCAALGAGLLTALAAPAFAQGNSNSGSGLSPYAADSGNDRSAGVNNGNNTLRRYRQRPDYGQRRVYERRDRRRAAPYYGYRY